MIRLSASERVITPSLDKDTIYLCGHAMRTEAAKGVLDDIYCKVLCFDDNSVKLLWISLEIIGIDKEVTNDIKQKIACNFDVSIENITISFTHTHSGPDCVRAFCQDEEKTADYISFLQGKIMETVDQVMHQQFTEVMAKFKSTTIDGYYSNRNGIDKPADKEIIQVIFEDLNKKAVAVLCSLACHPTVLGPQNLYISADLAGYIATFNKQKYQCLTFVMQGAAGDMSNRIFREGNDYAELNRMGKGITDQLDKNNDWKELGLVTIKSYQFEYKDKFYQDINLLKKRVLECQERIKNAKTFDEKKVYSSALKHANNKVDNFKSRVDFELCTKYMKLGDLEIFTIPAELFSRFGLEIKEAMTGKCNILWGYCDYSVGYLYNQEDAGKSFESIVTNIPAGTTEKIVDKAKEFIHTY